MKKVSYRGSLFNYGNQNWNENQNEFFVFQFLFTKKIAIESPPPGALPRVPQVVRRALREALDPRVGRLPGEPDALQEGDQGCPIELIPGNFF